MALIVEDGTGVDNANSYVDLTFADDYFSQRGVQSWADASVQDKEVALIKATDYIELRFRDRWKGLLSEEVTTLSFPRTYLYDRKGQPVTDVPGDVKKAVCEYALRAINSDLLPDPVSSDNGGNIKRVYERVGPIESETEYQQGHYVFRPYPSADKLLSFWVLGSGKVIR